MANWVSFAEVKSRVTLEQVLRAYQVKGLRRSGRHQYRGRCPIHQGEGREAFHANLARNVFHCFACEAGGNVLDFVAVMERSSVREAALRLQENYLCGAQQAPPARVPFRPAEAQLVTKKERAMHLFCFLWPWIAPIRTWFGGELIARRPSTLGWASAEATD